MAEEEITKPRLVSFNIDEQKAVQDLGTVMDFSTFAHVALAEKIDRERISKGIGGGQSGKHN